MEMMTMKQKRKKRGNILRCNEQEKQENDYLDSRVFNFSIFSSVTIFEEAYFFKNKLLNPT